VRRRHTRLVGEPFLRPSAGSAPASLLTSTRGLGAPEHQTAGDPGVERLRARFTAALPNGFCTLSSTQRCEFRPNPCFGCSFYNPGGRVFLGTHIAHRDQLQLLAADAHQRGDDAAAELNTTMLNQVTELIDDINPHTTPEAP
jgi:hypothetical protein